MYVKKEDNQYIVTFVNENNELKYTTWYGETKSKALNSFMENFKLNKTDVSIFDPNEIDLNNTREFICNYVKDLDIYDCIKMIIDSNLLKDINLNEISWKVKK